MNESNDVSQCLNMSLFYLHLLLYCYYIAIHFLDGWN